MNLVGKNLEYNELKNNEYSPLLLKDMDKALRRVVSAINNREKIVIYGSCNVDGITATALILLLLKYLNADVEYFIPNERDKNLNLCCDSIINHINFLGATLLITVGCGSESIKEFEVCKQLGIDVIVTDYHKCKSLNDKEELAIVVNPNKSDCTYANKELSASGVAFKFAQAIATYYEMKGVNKYLDLVVLGTIAGGFPLEGENQKIVEYGMMYLSSTNNYGIRALINMHKINDINIGTVKKLISKVVPCIGYGKKIDNARIAVELFTADNLYRAEQISKYLYNESQFVLACKL